MGVCTSRGDQQSCVAKHLLIARWCVESHLSFATVSCIKNQACSLVFWYPGECVLKHAWRSLLVLCVICCPIYTPKVNSRQSVLHRDLNGFNRVQTSQSRSRALAWCMDSSIPASTEFLRGGGMGGGSIWVALQTPNFKGLIFPEGTLMQLPDVSYAQKYSQVRQNLPDGPEESAYECNWPWWRALSCDRA